MAKPKAELEVETTGAWCKGDFDMQEKARRWAELRAAKDTAGAAALEKEFADRGLSVTEARPGHVVVARAYRDPSKKPESSQV